MAHIKLVKTRRQYKPKESNVKAYHSARWDRIRKTMLRDYPLCQRCLEQGRSRASQLVHHIIPWQTGRTETEQDELMYSYDNLQCLCHVCHNEIHHKMNISAGWERIKR